MSGLEVSVAVGLASNIIQFVDFTARLSVRIKEIYTSSSGLPKELEKQAVQLSSLSATLKELASQPEGATLAYGVWKQCDSEAKELGSLLERFEVGSDRRRLKIVKLALHSLRQNKEIEKVRETFSMNLLPAMSSEREY